MPEWYLAILILALLSALGFAWPPLLAALPLLGFAVGALAVQAGVSAARARFHRAERSRRTTLKLYALTALLYLLQPIARLRGRFAHGLTPWRRRGPASSVVPPRRHSWSFWRERGRTAAEHLADLSDALREAGAVVRAGGDFDRWDLEVRLGSLGASRILLAPEEHGAGRQLLRFRIYPWVPPAWLTLAALSLAAGVGAAIGRRLAGRRCRWALVALLVAARAWFDSGQAIGVVRGARWTTPWPRRSSRSVPNRGQEAARRAGCLSR